MTRTDLPAPAQDLGPTPVTEADPDSAVARAAALRPDRASMIDAYFRHVPAEDQPGTAQDVLGIIDGHWRVGEQRSPGEVRIRVFNPAPSGNANSDSDSGRISHWGELRGGLELLVRGRHVLLR